MSLSDKAKDRNLLLSFFIIKKVIDRANKRANNSISFFIEKLLMFLVINSKLEEKNSCFIFSIICII